MKTLTVRVPEELAAAIDEEYPRYGFGTRSDYLRAILEDRHRTTPGDGRRAGDGPVGPGSELAARVADLEARVEALETQDTATATREDQSGPAEWVPVEDTDDTAPDDPPHAGDTDPDGDHTGP